MPGAGMSRRAYFIFSFLLQLKRAYRKPRLAVDFAEGARGVIFPLRKNFIAILNLEATTRIAVLFAQDLASFASFYI